jgi:BirA family biotin operon repressor/biotin-[acetyl-CoA-carboxylase] ligase
VVSAQNQTNGKGQMGSTWLSEAGKNMIFSILIKNMSSQIDDVFLLNKVVAITLHQFLLTNKINNVHIKWPNDILAGSKKIAGVLIENLFRHDSSIDCIIGIGLNVNQKKFDNLPFATSLYLESNVEFNIQKLLIDFCERLKSNLSFYKMNQALVSDHYNQKLFKINKPAAFEDLNGIKFMGIIRGVDENGALNVELEDDLLKKFKLKEIKMLF